MTIDGHGTSRTMVALGGEGIGPEVIDVTCEVMVKGGVPVEILTPPHGEGAIKSHGHPIPDETKRLCESADGVLFGAAGGPPTSAVVGWLRWEKGTYASVRPVKHYPGASSPLAHPAGIDYVIVRELSEGLYPGREGELADLARAIPDLKDKFGRHVAEYGTGRFAVKIVTRTGVERAARFACDVARKRKTRGSQGKLTCITKSNVMPYSDGLFQQVVAEVVKREYPELTHEHFYVDDGARRLVRFPRQMDVVLTMNLYGDILSDLGAETAGGLGMAPSGCYREGWAYFESVHGSAPDIAGRGIANPTGAMLSAAMMLDHMKLESEATRLEAAVARVYRDGKTLTTDQGGKASTTEFGRAVLEAYRNS
jgi:isocitrate/isopropylmalate dehydrogenase